MTQDIYDDPHFFAGYATLDRSVNGLDGAPEWPALQKMLPPLRGKIVVDLGCGYGGFSRWTRGKGAAKVTGHDVSQKMLAKARSMTEDPDIDYQRCDLETLHLTAQSIDLAPLAGAALSQRYQRACLAPCSPRSNPAACWFSPPSIPSTPPPSSRAGGWTNPARSHGR